MQTSQLDQIMRQKDPELLRAVQHLANGETKEGNRDACPAGPRHRDCRPAGADRGYREGLRRQPENTIIVSPDNRSRQQINEAVRGELLKKGDLAEDGQRVQDALSSLRYDRRRSHLGGDVRARRCSAVRPGSKAEGIERDSFGVVRNVDASTNTADRRACGRPDRDVRPEADLWRERLPGDQPRVRDRRPAPILRSGRELGVSNRDMGTITKMEPRPNDRMMDGKEERSVSFDPAEIRQFDHGYAVTSHSSQGLTADRVIANIDTDSSAQPHQQPARLRRHLSRLRRREDLHEQCGDARAAPCDRHHQDRRGGLPGQSRSTCAAEAQERSL